MLLIQPYIMNKIVCVFITASLLVASCHKDSNEYDNSVKANLSVEFDNVVGATDLQLNTGSYTNAAGESYKITKLKYYVSNFKVTKTDGSAYTVPQNDCYFIIDESNASTHHPLLQVPEGEYKTLSFVVGVDSLRNTMDVSQRTGNLDISAAAADLYWSWNSGYIFFRLDGNSPVITSGGGVFQYHIGGFGGYATPTVNNLKTITIDLTGRGTAKVKAGKNTNIHLMVDVAKSLSGTTNMSFATTPSIHSLTAGTPVAKNYTSMFSHLHTEN
jgi:hypothetical protein